MTDSLRFTKMHGAGNDYLFVDATVDTPNLDPQTIERLSNRRTGIGSDGLVLIERSDIADLRMRMFNADGSEGAMCGNAIRCVAKFGLERGLTTNNPMAIETLTGVKTIECQLNNEGAVVSARVDMGPPQLKSTKIPVLADSDEVLDIDFTMLEPTIASGKHLHMTCISMGNPHAVFFVEELTDELVLEIGPQIETCKLFPDRTNVEFATVNNRSEITMRVWERGSGETHACGTGACAVAVAAILTGRTDHQVTVHLLGGDLEIEWTEAETDDAPLASVFKTGPAEFVFDGVCDI